MDSFSHRPVLLYETVDALNVKPDGVYVDCTLGGGGHTALLLSRLKEGRLIAFDQDADAIDNAKKKFADEIGRRLILVHRNFEEAGTVLSDLAPEGLDGVMMDLGVSSHQFDTAERGFSYHMAAPLDMRMDQRAQRTAKDVVNTYSKSRLCRILKEYGEEKYALAIAEKICKARETAPIETTTQLAEIIKSAVPAKERFEGKHPARRSFQAIRIEVNRELEVIETALDALIPRLRAGGRIAVITFHSLEDRIVKDAFARRVSGCTCPRDFPVCVCGFQKTLDVVTRKPITPSKQELEENPRSRSAKLRVAEKCRQE